MLPVVYYSNTLQDTFTMEVNTMNPDQTVPMGAYRLQYRQPKNKDQHIKKMRKQTAFVLKSEEKVYSLLSV